MRKAICIPLWIALTAACGKSGEDSKAPPPPPASGSPISVEFVGFSGEGDDREIKASLYNHGDKPAVSYIFLARFYDAEGNRLTVKEGTAFESDTNFTSMSGNAFRCEPQKRCAIAIHMRDIPDGAQRAELVASKVGTADGMKAVDWFSQEDWTEWPE
jgi:hypothetical protein